MRAAHVGQPLRFYNWGPSIFFRARIREKAQTSVANVGQEVVNDGLPRPTFATNMDYHARKGATHYKKEDCEKKFIFWSQ